MAGNEQDLGAVLSGKRIGKEQGARDLARELEAKREAELREKTELEQGRVALVRERIHQLNERKSALEAQSAELTVEHEKVGPLRKEVTSAEESVKGLYSEHADILKAEGYTEPEALRKTGSQYRGTKQVHEVRAARAKEIQQKRALRKTHRKIVAEHTQEPDLEIRGRAPKREDAQQALQTQIDQIAAEIQELHWQTPEGHDERVETVRAELSDAPKKRAMYHSIRTQIDRINTVNQDDLRLADSIYGDGREVVKGILKDGFQARLEQETEEERKRRSLPEIEEDLERLRAFPREVVEAERRLGEVSGLREQAFQKIREAGREKWYLHSLETNAGIDRGISVYSDSNDFFRDHYQREIDGLKQNLRSGAGESALVEELARHLTRSNGGYIQKVDNPRMILHKLDLYRRLYSRIIETPESELPEARDGMLLDSAATSDIHRGVIESKWSLADGTRRLIASKSPYMDSHSVEEAEKWTKEQEGEIAGETERAQGLLEAKIDVDWSNGELARFEREHPDARQLADRSARMARERQEASSGLMTLAELRAKVQDLAGDRVEIGESYNRLFLNDLELVAQRNENGTIVQAAKDELRQHSNILVERLNSLDAIDPELQKARVARDEQIAKGRPRLLNRGEYDSNLHHREEALRLLEVIRTRTERNQSINERISQVKQTEGLITSAGLQAEFVGKTMLISEFLDTLQARLEEKSTANFTESEQEVFSRHTQLRADSDAKHAAFEAKFKIPRQTSRR